MNPEDSFAKILLKSLALNTTATVGILAGLAIFGTIMEKKNKAQTETK